MRLNFVAAVLAASALASTAQAQTKWDMPTPYADGEFHTRNVMLFVEQVGKATGGQLDIKVHSNGSLIKHPELMRAVSTGQVNIGEFLLGQFANEEPVFAVDNLPFLAAGYDTIKSRRNRGSPTARAPKIRRRQAAAHRCERDVPADEGRRMIAWFARLPRPIPRSIV